MQIENLGVQENNGQFSEESFNSIENKKMVKTGTTK